MSQPCARRDDSLLRRAENDPVKRSRTRWVRRTVGRGRPAAIRRGAGVDLGTVVLQSFPVPAGFPVDQFLAHWWVFPASIRFSMIALASGVSGALLFSPFFLLVVGLQPAQAIGAGLLTEVFGMGNGLLNYVRQRTVDYATANWLLPGAVPAVVVVRSPPTSCRRRSSRSRSMLAFSYWGRSSSTIVAFGSGCDAPP